MVLILFILFCFVHFKDLFRGLQTGLDPFSVLNFIANVKASHFGIMAIFMVVRQATTWLQFALGVVQNWPILFG